MTVLTFSILTSCVWAALAGWLRARARRAEREIVMLHCTIATLVHLPRPFTPEQFHIEFHKQWDGDGGELPPEQIDAWIGPVH